MHKELIEGTTRFVTDSEEKISREMEVFYNPVMKLNRDTTLAMLLAMESDGRKAGTLRVGLPMEASGVRAARILNELVGTGLFLPRCVAINDLSPIAIEHAKENIALNKEGIADDAVSRFTFSVLDANIFLRSSPHFDYIDIDPFGTPNQFLDAAAQRIERGGIIAVTATDTSALAGTYPRATARKYWSVPSRTWLMHDVGLRILARKVQLIGAQYEKALVPVLSMSTDHYYRIFFRCERSHTTVKDVIRNHRFLNVCASCMQTTVSSENNGACTECGAAMNVAGPLWTGALHDITMVKRMRESANKLEGNNDEKKRPSELRFRELSTLLAIIEEECRVDSVGFYDVHEIASRHKVAVPRRDALLAALGEHACRTHISGHGIKTDLPIAKIIEAMRTLSQ
jgi:tRNA (guanine26-N2/guanine27-N2)-dimethyltransferase